MGLPHCGNYPSAFRREPGRSSGREIGKSKDREVVRSEDRKMDKLALPRSRSPGFCRPPALTELVALTGSVPLPTSRSPALTEISVRVFVVAGVWRDTSREVESYPLLLSPTSLSP